MGTKKFRFVIVLFVAAFLGAMIFAHRKSLNEVKEKYQDFESLYKTEQQATQLKYSLEHYRRLSGSFRKMDTSEIAKAKSDLKKSFALNLLGVGESATIREQLSDLLAQSAEIEKVSYTKDAYQKETIRDLHASIQEKVEGLQKDAQNKIDGLGTAISVSDARTMEVFYGSSIIVLTLLFALLIENYLVFFRPLNKLHGYAGQLRAGQFTAKGLSSLPGIYGDIQGALTKLAENVEGHIKERHKFIRDVVTDLRSPLNMLQAGKRKHGLAILSGSLDDLTDIASINKMEGRLDETVVDLTELVSDVSKMFEESSQNQTVTFSVPPMPIWTKLDRRRFERVLIHVISKVASTFNGKVHMTITETQAKEGRGVEIAVFDASRLRKNHPGVVSTGPELEILKHWISESGLSMALAYKIIRAHNGAIHASGVNGTAVQILIRLPAERIVGSGLIMPPDAVRLTASGPQEAMT